MGQSGGRAGTAGIVRGAWTGYTLANDALARRPSEPRRLKQMTLSSMTGFSRAGGQIEGARFHWELRSVNGRGLDVRLRLPPGYEGLEPAGREVFAAKLVRGHVTAHLLLEGGPTSGEVRINERALATVLVAVERLSGRDIFDRPRPEGVLALRGVIELGEAAEGDAGREAATASLLGALGTAVGALVEARRIEGGRLGVVLSGALDRIEVLVGQIRAAPARRPEAVRARLGEQIERLLGQAGGFDTDRLYQEAVLIATRIDVEEELDRLGAHIQAARALLADKAAVGRRFDFLAQEFNREANTICSKSNDIEITRLGLELKAVIDQLREQVQNIE